MKQPIIFLHIPKSGGSTFHTILRKKFKKPEIYNIFGARNHDPEVIKFVELAEAEREKIGLLKGHMPFGLHQHLPGAAKYISFLRDPVDAVVSRYYYIKKNAHNPKHEQVHGAGMSISEFVTSGVVFGTNNCHCRFLTGEIDRLSYGENKDLYQNAIDNIERHFLWVGITERFDESILVLAELLGWKKPPYYIKQNVNTARKSKPRLSDDDRKIIASYNQDDQALYQYANEKLDAQINKIADFDQKLADFQKVNQKISRRYAWLPDNLQQLFVG